LELPLINGGVKKSFIPRKVDELRNELLKNKDAELYRKVITLFHPYREFSNSEMSSKLNIFREALNSYGSFEDFIITCQFYSYALLEKFEAIGFWVAPDALTIITGNDLQSFDAMYAVVRKHLTAHSIWESSRGPGQVRGK